MKNYGHFKIDMLILCVLSAHDCYGYDITSKIKEISDGFIDFKEGTIYPILYKLLDKGYVTTYQKIVGKKIRIYYHLEESGREYMENLICQYNLWERKVRKIINIRN